MVKFMFSYITQFRNLTDQTVSFSVDDLLFSISDLPPGKTRMVKLSQIIQYCRRQNSPDWKIYVLIDGQFTGMRMTGADVLYNVRILFNHGIIEGVREDKRTDYLLRDRFLGWMRNRYWDKRPNVVIATAPSKMAPRLRSAPLKEHTRNARESISLPRRRSRRGTRIAADKFEMGETPDDLKKPPLARAPYPQRQVSTKEHTTGNAQESISLPLERSSQGTHIAAHSRIAADRFEMEETPTDLKTAPLTPISSPQWPSSTKEHTTRNAQESLSLPRERSRLGTRIAAHRQMAADRFEMEETPTDLKTAPWTRISSPQWSAPPEEHTRNNQERILSQESSRRDTRTTAHNRVVNRHVPMDSFVYTILFILALAFTGFLRVSMG